MNLNDDPPSFIAAEMHETVAGCALPLSVHVPAREPLPLPLREERGRGHPTGGQGRGELEGTFSINIYTSFYNNKQFCLLE